MQRAPSTRSPEDPRSKRPRPRPKAKKASDIARQLPPQNVTSTNVKIQAAWRGSDARWMRDTDECGDLWLRRTLDIMSVEQKLAARCIQRRWRAQQYQRYLDGVPLKTQWRAADKIQGEWREYYYDRSYYFYDMWGNLRRFENHLDAQGNYVGPDAWYFRVRAESALQIQAAWRAWPGPLIPSWFWATNKTNNICEE